eukprot:1153203-Pelagomonas_calceolata.AAC.2
MIQIRPWNNRAAARKASKNQNLCNTGHHELATFHKKATTNELAFAENTMGINTWGIGCNTHFIMTSLHANTTKHSQQDVPHFKAPGQQPIWA